MGSFRSRLRGWIPGPVRRRYHRYALRRDFGIDPRAGRASRRPLDAGLLPGVNVIGYFESPSGVGQSTRLLADAAERVGIAVARLTLDPWPKDSALRAPYDVNLYHINADGTAGVVEELGPKLHGGRANVGYWYWETESFPPRWRDRFAYFDEIWVASEFCRRSIAEISPVPVELVPPAAPIPDCAPDSRVVGKTPGSDFVFLTLLDASSVPERKNPEGTVRAFARAFPKRCAAALEVSIRNADGAPGLVERLREAAGDARVEISEGPLFRHEVDARLAACDAYVSLHRAEGLGLPLIEAMALGKPVIATAYSGSTDYLDETTGFPVSWTYRELPGAIRDYDAGTRWAEPDEGDAARLLRQVFEDQQDARHRAAQGRRRIAQLYGQDIVGANIAARLEALRRRLRESS